MAARKPALRELDAAVEKAIGALVRFTKGRSFSITYDVGYGIDKRTGWSVTIDGSVAYQFAETMSDAIRLALLNASRWHPFDLEGST
jgi:hypothetical protein